MGVTSSRDFPVRRGIQRLYGGGGWHTPISGDIFVAAFAPGGRPLRWSTYLGGNGNDSGSWFGENGNTLALGPHQNVYVVGTTFSPNFPTKGRSHLSTSHEAGGFLSQIESR
jgi:hypothetical protein